MMIIRELFIIFILFIYGCATQVPRPRLEVKDHDLFRNESLTQYSINNLDIIIDKKSNAAVALCHKGKISDGLEMLKKSFASQKNSPIYWLQIGNCYYLNNNQDKAKFFYTISLDTAAKNEMLKSYALNNMGVLYLKNNHILEAKEYFEQARKSNPELVTPSYNLSQILIRFGLLTEALKILSPLETQNPKSVDLLASLGTIYTLDGNPELAIKYFKRVPAEILKREDISCSYALSLYSTKNYVEAKNVLSERQSLGITELSTMADKLKDEIDKETEKLEKAKPGKKK